MRNKQLFNGLLTITIMLGALTTVRAQDIAQTETISSGENVILQWNRVLKETLSTPGQHPPTIFPIRSYAMMHAAMFDAVNSIDRSYTPYLTMVDERTVSPSLLKSRGIFRFASKEAAAAQAARDVLVGLYPGRQAVYDAELANSLNSISYIQAQLGISIGRIVAARMLAHRAGDGWNAPLPPYVLSTAPGNWQPTPPNFPVAGITQLPSVLPFAIVSGSQFPSPPPPAMTSAEYAADFNEVKELGAAGSATRTAHQTQTARLHAGIGTPTQFWFVWNNVAGSISAARGMTTVENARLFALMNIAYHDTLQTTMTGKYIYGLWRPVTAIRRADEDGNPNTAPDANWLSLLGNPPYPTYPGNLASVGASQATIMTLFFGRDDIAFEHTWDGAGGATRSYTSFSELAGEQDRSRVYGGIHFKFDQTAGINAGRDVSNYVFLNFFRPQ